MTSGQAGVGVECQGFAQKHHTLAQMKHKHKHHQKAKKDWYEDAWVDPCDASYKEGPMTGGQAGVGVECQGFAQKKGHNLAQKEWYENQWVDDCDSSYTEGPMTPG